MKIQDKGKGDTAWFVHDRFGMFIHWGLYSMPARHEWIRYKEEMTDEQYSIYFNHFDPDHFCPATWARLAANAGMKYVVITAKHHEGFCLWNSEYTNFKATNTPVGRDLLRELIDAFRAEGLRIGLYYSLIDWHHKDFVLDEFHPYRNKVDRDKFNQGRDMKRYAQYMRDQATELLSNYGKIDIMWFDFSYPQNEFGKGRDDWESAKLVEHIRSLQPDIILDNRLDLPEAGDIMTPEQYTPDTPFLNVDGTPAVWEGCQTFSGSWGYYRDEMSWKSVEMCIEMLVNHVSCGGNLLMNVGPTSRGDIDRRAERCLEGFAEWMYANSRAIYGCGAAPVELIPPRDCRYTYNQESNRLYLHCLTYPFKHVHLNGLAGKVEYAQLLFDGSEIQRRKPIKNIHVALNSDSPDHAVTLELPPTLPEGCKIPVIEIFLNGRITQ